MVFWTRTEATSVVVEPIKALEKAVLRNTEVVEKSIEETKKLTKALDHAAREFQKGQRR